MRKASQVRRSRRTFKIFGTTSTSAKSEAIAALRRRAPVVSSSVAAGVEVVLITVRSGATNVLAPRDAKAKSIRPRREGI
jgi:hypothetical protein